MLSASWKERKSVSGIENDLLSVHLSSEKQQNLIQMINDGASDEELMNLINDAAGGTV